MGLVGRSVGVRCGWVWVWWSSSRRMDSGCGMCVGLVCRAAQLAEHVDESGELCCGRPERGRGRVPSHIWDMSATTYTSVHSPGAYIPRYVRTDCYQVPLYQQCLASAAALCRAIPVRLLPPPCIARMLSVPPSSRCRSTTVVV